MLTQSNALLPNPILPPPDVNLRPTLEPIKVLEKALVCEKPVHLPIKTFSPPDVILDPDE